MTQKRILQRALAMKHAGGVQPAAIERLAFNVHEVAAALGIGRTRIYELVAEGRILITKIGHRSVVLASDLDAFVADLRAARGTPVSSVAVAAPTVTPSPVATFGPSSAYAPTTTPRPARRQPSPSALPAGKRGRGRPPKA